MKLNPSQMTMLSLMPLMLTLYLYIKSMFISLEIPIMQLNLFYISMSLIMDWFSCLFLSTVMFISSMILMFSTQYIPKTEQNQFSMLLLMFVLSMTILIMSDNMIFILLGWDGLGLSSYILVIYYQNFSSAASGTITIISNRMGDIMILTSISMMIMSPNWNFTMNESFIKLTMILLTLAACSKSAQFPFSAWLPAAMAAPTPISALVHSSTLVTAGVYLLIRIMNFNHPYSMTMMLMISTLTAIYASMSACWEQDLKKIIALSTLSQIAMMMFAISMGSTMLAFFHLIIHALFKSMMFLSAGIMIHSSSYQDMRHMSTNTSPQPSTMISMGISNMALMGIPFMSGFFSKDSIIELMISSYLMIMLTPLMVMSIGMTAIYSLRLISKSMKLMMKSKPDTLSHNQTMMDLPILMMLPTSISTGAMMMWLMTPEQTFIIPLTMKNSIITMLMLGMLTGLLMTFNTKKFMFMGKSAITLWFNHLLSTSLTNKSTPSMNLLLSNDKQWQEMYGPNLIYKKNKLFSPISQKPLMTWMFMSLLISFPMIIMILL